MDAMGSNTVVFELQVGETVSLMIDPSQPSCTLAGGGIYNSFSGVKID